MRPEGRGLLFVACMQNVIRSMTIVIKLMTDYVHARRKLPARGVKMAAEALHTPSLR